jgi:hypothetical protein
MTGSDGTENMAARDVKVIVPAEQLAPCVKAQVARGMNRPCHRPRAGGWPERAFAGLAARVSDAARAYDKAARVRRLRLEAMYGAKVAQARARAAYRQAKRVYATACRSTQAAKTHLEDLQRAYDQAFRDAYVEWLARHPRADHDDRLLALHDLARLRGVTVTQMARLLGYRAARTSDEVAEDIRRYLTGTPVLVIARERGISRQAVYDRIRQHKIGSVRSIPPGYERPDDEHPDL